MKRLFFVVMFASATACATEATDDDDGPGGSTSRSCGGSPIVGGWAIAAFPTGPVLNFESDCVFAGDARTDCGDGTVTFSRETAAAGQLTLSVNGVACQSCEYDVDEEASPRRLEFGCPDISGEFVESE